MTVPPPTVNLPQVPSRPRAGRRHGAERVAREASRTVSGPHTAARSRSVKPWASSLLARLDAVSGGSQLLNTQPWSLAETWAWHRAAAQFWKPAPPPPFEQQLAAWEALPWWERPDVPHPLLHPPRVPQRAVWAYRLRLAWGAFHVCLAAAPVYFLCWIFQTFPRRWRSAGRHIC